MLNKLLDKIFFIKWKGNFTVGGFVCLCFMQFALLVLIDRFISLSSEDTLAYWNNVHYVAIITICGGFYILSCLWTGRHNRTWNDTPENPHVK